MYTIASAGFMRMENVGLPSVWPLQALDALCRLMSTALESLCFQLPSQAHVNGLGRLMLKNYVVEVAHFTMWWISFQVHATFASKNKQKTCMISYRKAGDACGMNLCSAIETIREREPAYPAMSTMESDLVKGLEKIRDEPGIPINLKVN